MVSGRKRLSILGATGSVGRSTVDVVASLGAAERYETVALVGGSNAALLADQARALRAQVAVVHDEAAYPALRAALAGTGIEAAAGQAAVMDAARMDVDWCMSAIAGAAGLEPTLAAARTGAAIALANKESMVCAGPLMLETVAAAGGRILPVDSEHSAIFQVFEAERAQAVERIILTASGGPFRSWSKARMRAVTPQQAMAHPKWSMGVGISIDSATMFNKGLELIEAARLFPVSPEKIEILIHPQSVVHSMVGYCDGSVLAQLGAPDMRTPIAYALGWPDRVAAPVERLDFPALSRLDFEAPDEARFPALRLAREALEAGGLAPCVLNAAKEAAVEAFIAGRVGFLDVAQIAEQVMAESRMDGSARDLGATLAADAAARRAADHLARGDARAFG